jgi:PucR C-terminal helix-turn-helix domain
MRGHQVVGADERAGPRARLGPGVHRAAVVGDGERERLTQTLAARLDHQRQTPQIAEALHVHPQTVRYRIAKLRQLLGDDIDDPNGRFDLQLAVRISSERYRRTRDT